jgi:hypothetical protein
MKLLTITDQHFALTDIIPYKNMNGCAPPVLTFWGIGGGERNNPFDL